MMDSVLPDDPTLPFQFDASVDNSQLPDLSMMSSPMKNAVRLSDPGPAVFNVLGESPGNSVMKDFGTQISDLKKENFSLKLRIFYMEERMNENAEGESHDQIWRTNIELKVECDNLKKELQTKHDLLVKASNAVACMYTKPSDDDKIREDAQQEVEQLREIMNEKVDAAEKDLFEVRREAAIVADRALQFQKQLGDLKDENKDLHKNLEDARMKIHELTLTQVGSQDQSKFRNQEYTDIQNQFIAGQLELEKANRTIEDLRNSLSSSQCVIELLNEEKERLLKSQPTENEHHQHRLQEMEELLNAANARTEKTDEEYRDHITKQQEKLDDFENAAHLLTTELDKKQQEIEELKKDCAEKERGLKSNAEKKANEDVELKEKGEKSDKVENRREKAIFGLTQLLNARNAEIETLKNQISTDQRKLEKLYQKADDNNDIIDQLQKKNEEIENMRKQLTEAQLKIEDYEAKPIQEQDSSKMDELKNQVQQCNFALQVQTKEILIMRGSYERQVEDLKGAIIQKELDVNLLNEELRRAIKEVVDMNNNHELEVNELQNRIELQQESRVIRIEKEAQTENQDLENEFENQVESLNQELNEKEKQIELLKSQIFEHEETVSSLDGIVRSRNKEIDEIQKCNENSLANLQMREAECIEIKQQRDMLNMQCDVEKSMFSKLANKLLDRKGVSSDSREENNSLENQLKLCSESLKELIEERDNLYSDLEEANCEIEELKEGQYNLEQQHKLQADKLKKLREEFKSKEEEMQKLESNLKDELENMASLNNELQTKLNGYKEEFGNPENSGHQQEVESLRSEVDELNKELLDANHALKNMQRKVDFYSDSEFSSDCSSSYGLSYSKSSKHKSTHKRYNKKCGPRLATSDASDTNFNQYNGKFKKSLANDTANTTFLHLNQTSYMDIATPNGYRGDHTDHVSDDPESSFVNMNSHEMKQVLMNTRNQLADALAEVKDLRTECADHFDNLRQLEEEVIGKDQENQQLKNLYQTACDEKMMKESEVLGLLSRIKDKELSKEKNPIVQNGIISDSEHSVASYRSLESNGMSSLHKSELQDVIANLKQKLLNAEKVNDILKTQNETNTVEMQEKLHQVQTQMESLKLEKEKLEKEKILPSNPIINSKIPLPKASKLGEGVLRQELERARMLNGKLNKRIIATEESVRQQADRLNKCKIALREAGVASPPMSPIRGARSVPNLASPSHHTPAIEEYQGSGFLPQQSQSAKKLSSLSPSSEQKFNSLIQSQAKELSNLREQLSFARDCSKRLKQQSDILTSDVSSLLSSCGDFIDEEVIGSVGKEVAICHDLVREIKNHLHDTDSTSSQSEEEITQNISSKLFKPNHGKLNRLNQELDEKAEIIRNLEKKIKENSTLDGSMHTPKKFSPETKDRHGLLTPTTSHHSIHSIYDDEVLDKLASSTSMVEDKYKKLPPVSPRQLPTYQRTIAITEYLPPVYKDSPSKRMAEEKKLSRFSLNFGGAWSSPGQPKSSISVNNSLYDHESSCDDGTSHENHKLSREVERLRRRLSDQKRINRTLKEELELAMSSLEKAKENFVPGYQRKLSNKTDNLMEHLSEIRGLRQRLEHSISTNDKLREKLDAQLDLSTDKNVATNIYLPYDQRSSQQNSTNPNLEEKMKQTYSDAIEELKNLQKNLREKSSQTDLLASHIDQLQHELQQQTNLSLNLGKELNSCKNELSNCKDKLEKVENEKENANAETKHLKNQSKRLYKEVEDFQVQMNESHQLIESLKSELNLHEQLNQRPTDDFSEFLEEIRSLRVELERSIEANTALRKNLQDQLERNPQRTTINIHHLTPPEHQRISKSAPTTARRRLHLDTVAPPSTRNNVFMTPPASGSSDGGKTFTFEASLHNGSQSPPLHCIGGPYTLCKTSHFKKLRDNIYDSSLLVRQLDKHLQQSNTIDIGRRSKNNFPNLDVSKLSSSIHHLRNLLDVSEDTLKLFWPCNIPHSHELDAQSFTSSGVHSSGSEMNSSFYKRGGDSNKEADGLRKEVGKLRRRLNTQDRLLKSTVDRLHSTNKMKEGIENSIAQQITKTHEVLRKARGNLEANVICT